ncbi:hypothetical protein MNBD_GAMMA12-3398 [hydrothermal vent metagenome]|uniref:Uncharacterized protein n=1 Tax=hydrothermal vent metagenome TaxID=652676 RepID=A0A3B0Y2A1_9ZZZZ
MEDNGYSADQINVIDLRQKSFVEALLEIEKRPWMWLERSNITCLKSFTNGWIVGRNEEADELLLADFDRFVVNEFSEGSSTLGWCALIMKHCGEEDPLTLFYAFFHKYMERQSR